MESKPLTPPESKAVNKEHPLRVARRSQLVNLPWVLLAVYFGWLVAPIFILIVKVLAVQYNSFTLTTDRLIEREGVFNQREEQLELYNIKDITRSATWLQRMLGCGDIRLQTSDITNPDLVIRWVYGSEELTESIRQYSNENKRDLRHMQSAVG